MSCAWKTISQRNLQSKAGHRKCSQFPQEIHSPKNTGWMEGWGVGLGLHVILALSQPLSLLEVSEAAQAFFPFPPVVCFNGRREIDYPLSMRIQAPGLLSTNDHKVLTSVLYKCVLNEYMTWKKNAVFHSGFLVSVLFVCFFVYLCPLQSKPSQGQEHDPLSIQYSIST